MSDETTVSTGDERLISVLLGWWWTEPVHYDVDDRDAAVADIRDLLAHLDRAGFSIVAGPQ